MNLPPVLEELLGVLRDAFPHGVPAEDYFPLLAVLAEDMSERSLAALVAELVDGETVVISNDAAAAQSNKRPSSADRASMRHRLIAAGWEFDDDAE